MMNTVARFTRSAKGTSPLRDTSASVLRNGRDGLAAFAEAIASAEGAQKLSTSLGHGSDRRQRPGPSVAECCFQKAGANEFTHICLIWRSAHVQARSLAPISGKKRFPYLHQTHRDFLRRDCVRSAEDCSIKQAVSCACRERNRRCAGSRCAEASGRFAHHTAEETAGEAFQHLRGS